MKKFFAVLALLSFGMTASAGLQEQCSKLPPSKMELQYPTAVIPSVVAGKFTAADRIGIRCFKVGDVLNLVDSKTKAVAGKVTVTEIALVDYNTVTAKAATRSGQPTVAALQAQLVQIYGEKIKTSPITEIFFNVIK